MGFKLNLEENMLHFLAPKIKTSGEFGRPFFLFSCGINFSKMRGTHYKLKGIGIKKVVDGVIL